MAVYWHYKMSAAVPPAAGFISSSLPLCRDGGVMSWNKLLLGSESQPILSAQSTSLGLTTGFMGKITAASGAG